MIVASFVICFEVEQQEAAATTVFFHPLLFWFVPQFIPKKLGFFYSLFYCFVSLHLHFTFPKNFHSLVYWMLCPRFAPP
jgi:hypothetical protein